MIEFQHKLPMRYNADGKACGKMILIKKTKESFLFILLNLNNGMMRICIQAMEIGFRASTLKNNDFQTDFFKIQIQHLDKRIFL